MSDYNRTPAMQYLLNCAETNTVPDIPLHLRHDPCITDTRGWTLALHWLWYIKVRGKTKEMQKSEIPDYLHHDPQIKERRSHYTIAELWEAWMETKPPKWMRE